MTSPTRFMVVLVTVPDADAGNRIAEAVVGERIAACVNRVPGVRSLFHWEGAVDSSEEELLLIKARESSFAVLSRRITELHPYAVPEILAFPILHGNQPYLAWLERETTP